jgi:hypothetical protein
MTMMDEWTEDDLYHEVEDVPCDEYGDYEVRIEDYYEHYDDEYEMEMEFADPGGRSALRAASRSNPRNIACPTCGRANMLTPADRARGYQCDVCADEAEGCY